VAELKINFAARLALVLGFLVLALAVSYGHNMKGLPGPAANPESVTAVMLKRLKIEVPQDVAAELPHLTVKANRIPAAVDAAPPFEGMTDASGADANRALICLTGAIYYEAVRSPMTGSARLHRSCSTGCVTEPSRTAYAAWSFRVRTARPAANSALHATDRWTAHLMTEHGGTRAR
jgi:hypothetical protein